MLCDVHVLIFMLLHACHCFVKVQGAPFCGVVEIVTNVNDLVIWCWCLGLADDYVVDIIATWCDCILCEQ